MLHSLNTLGDIPIFETEILGRFSVKCATARTREGKRGFFCKKNNDFIIKVAQKFAYNEFIIYLCSTKIKKGGVKMK